MDGAPDLLAYPKDRAAYGRLCRILTAGNLRAPKGECWLKLDDLLEHGEGLQVVGAPFSPRRLRTPVFRRAMAGEGGAKRRMRGPARKRLERAPCGATPRP